MALACTRPAPNARQRYQATGIVVHAQKPHLLVVRQRHLLARIRQVECVIDA